KMGNRRNYYWHDEDRPQRGYRDREAENERYFGGGMNFGEGYDPDDDDRRSFSGRGRSSASRRRYEYGGERPRFERDRAYGDYDKPGYPQDEPPYRATRSSYYDPATGTRYDVGPSRYGGRYPESEAGFDHDDHERGWWERTADEVSSWFGDEAA